ncbi:MULTISPECIES: pseudouridine synthase [Weeksella]|uniref:pseudouridine synthase n=1 Tax=Weeksella TaxID=1013 RepID=UPI0008A5598A|nr:MULTISPECIES: pseudouridine synthase [Weeksella]MDK7374535.1 pseudouridine synthase [Weeksella virosa]OFM83142.1 pseudouridylate synthase [Weeksella sp. HMSC059D05]
MIEILYQDSRLVAIHKPPGLLVHRSYYARDVKQFAVQELRNFLGGQHVYPIHRLDRKTAGVLLFALDKEMLSLMNEIFNSRAVTKEYWAIVRGYTEQEGVIDYPLTNDDGQRQDAKTYYQTLQHAEINLPFGKHATSRYSLVKALPETGRMHQLRKHLRHIAHPILGSRPHGCNKQNKLWLENFQLEQMMLLARSLRFTHPESQEEVCIKANPTAEFLRVCEILKINMTNFL